ncbi:MAG: fatty acid desaturase [Polyangiaceae bacterium]|nr:fatty acid desaturase [Polyangiaceae bacterium]
MQTTEIREPAEVPPSDARAERLKRFGEALDRVKARVEGELGEADVRYVKRLNAFSRGCEVVGRALIHFSFEPVGFGVGVIALWLHKQLQATEVGHTALHGAYDKLPGAERFRSTTFRWDTPIDEESWRYGHNGRHHGATNVAARDADIHFGQVRLTEQTPWSPRNRGQLPFSLLVLFPNFGFVMNTHFTGLNDVLFDNGRPERLDFLPDRSPASRRLAYRRTLRKFVPHYAKEYLFFPALAGPFFWKVMLGNWLAATLRDIYSAATIFCGHVGAHVASYPAGTKAKGRGEWYAMQAEASNNYQVSWPVSVLCGGLDMQIEHHLFPKLPPQRLRQIAPEVRALCAEHGVAYHTDSWGRTLKKALGWIHHLSRERGPVETGRELLRSMS